MIEFTVIGEITGIEPIARGIGVRERFRLNRLYGRARWRKVKGEALVRPRSGRIRKAELHCTKPTVLANVK